MSSAEKIVMPLMAAATSVLATGRFRNEPAMIAILVAIVLRGSQLVIVCEILSFIICNPRSSYNTEIQNKNFSCK